MSSQENPLHLRIKGWNSSFPFCSWCPLNNPYGSLNVPFGFLNFPDCCYQVFYYPINDPNCSLNVPDGFLDVPYCFFDIVDGFSDVIYEWLKVA